MRRRFVLGAMTLACALCLAPGAFAASNDLFFSEYVEGSSNNKALEIYNGTGAPIDLAAGDYSVQMFFNGNPASTLTIDLTGTVAAGDVFVLAQSSAAATILAAADQTNGAGWFNGDDAVALCKGDDRDRRDRADRASTRAPSGAPASRARPTTRSGASRASPTATRTARTRSTPRRSGTASPPTRSAGSAPTPPRRPTTRRSP